MLQWSWEQFFTSQILSVGLESSEYDLYLMNYVWDYISLYSYNFLQKIHILMKKKWMEQMKIN